MDLSIIKGQDHIGIPCRDLRRSAEFYGKLGFSVVSEVHDGPSGVDVVFLALGSLVIEIYRCDETGGGNGAIDHFAISVSDIDVVFEYVVGIGLEITTDGIEFLPFWKNGIRFFKVLGPNLESIEFIQKL